MNHKIGPRRSAAAGLIAAASLIAVARLAARASLLAAAASSCHRQPGRSSTARRCPTDSNLKVVRVVPEGDEVPPPGRQIVVTFDRPVIAIA